MGTVIDGQEHTEMGGSLRRALRIVLLAALLAAGLAAASTRAVSAQGPPPPDEPGSEEPAEGEEPGLLEQIVRHILVFPVETMQEATERLLLNILRRNAEGVRDLFSDLVAGLTLQNPGLKRSSGNPLWIGAGGIFADTWSFTVKIAVALWPATLAIMAAAAARDSALTSGWGIVELKQAMAEWLGGVLLCAFSLEILDLANRLSNALIVGIVSLPISGATDLSLQTVVNLLLGGALRVFGAGISPLAAIIATGVLLILGLATAIGLIGQYFARAALLYVVVALAPVVLVVSILRPARWLRWLWVKGVLLVMLLGPVTMLLLKLALAANNAITNPILSFLMVVGVVSMLLAISGAMIKAIFGAGAQVVGQAVGTVKGVTQGAATAALAVGAGLLSGGAALGVLPAGLSGPGLGGAAAAGGAGRGGLGLALAAAGPGGPATASTGTGGGSGGQGVAAREARAPSAPEKRGAPAGPTGPEGAVTTPRPPSGEREQAQGGPRGAGPEEGIEDQTIGPALEDAPAGGADAPRRPGHAFADRIRRGWARADRLGRTEAAGAAMRGAGAVLGPGSLAGRTMSAIGTGLDQTVRGQDRERRGPRAPRVPSLASTSRLTPPEVAGYTEALRDMQRDLKGPAEAAGLDLSAVERDALAPVWAAAQHQPLTSMARQAGFGDRASREEMVSDFVAHRLEEQLVARGFLGESVTRPGKPPATPLSDHPTLLDYDRGQRMRWATGGGDMATYAGLHHAIRRHAVVPQVGLAAARDFYEAAVASGSVSGAIEAARRHGASAGVPDARLDPWVRQLQRRT